MAKSRVAVTSSVPIEDVIREVRGQKVILDIELAVLYGVTTKRLKEQVKRNPERFPVDFAFVLLSQEVMNLRSQIATSSWGGSRYVPTAFTEHGAIMAANVLNSPKAVEMSVYVVRAFVQMGRELQSNAELTKRLDTVERRLGQHEVSIRSLVAVVRELIAPPREAAPRNRL